MAGVHCCSQLLGLLRTYRLAPTLLVYPAMASVVALREQEVKTAEANNTCFSTFLWLVSREEFLFFFFFFLNIFADFFPQRFHHLREDSAAIFHGNPADAGCYCSAAVWSASRRLKVLPGRSPFNLYQTWIVAQITEKRVKSNERQTELLYFKQRKAWIIRSEPGFSIIYQTSPQICPLSSNVNCFGLLHVSLYSLVLAPFEFGRLSPSLSCLPLCHADKKVSACLGGETMVTRQPPVDITAC